MAVTRRIHGNAGSEVQKQVAVDVLDDGAAAALDDQRIGTRVRRRHELVIACQEFLGLRPGKVGLNLWDGMVVEMPHWLISLQRQKKDAVLYLLLGVTGRYDQRLFRIVSD